MASGSLVGGGPADAPPEKSKWSGSSKVYVRKFKRSKPAPISQLPPPAAAAEAPASDEASHPPPKLPEPLSPPPPPTRVDSSAPSASSQNPAPSAANGEPAVVTISLASRSKEDVRELREKLTSELAHVRALIRRIESRQVNLAPSADYTVSQVSGDEAAVSPVHPEPQVEPVSNFEPPALPPPIAISQFSGSNDMPEYQEEVYAAEEPQEPVHATEEPASARRPTTVFRIPSSNDGLVTPVFPKPGSSYAEPVYAYQDPTPPLRQLTISQFSGGHDDSNTPVPAYSEAVYASTTSVPPLRQFPGNGVPITPVSAYSEAVYVSTVPPSHYRPVSEFPQFSGNNEPTFTPLPPRRFFASSEAAGYVPPVHAPPSRRLSISVPDNNMEYMEREKRTPKANQYYQNSDFILGTEKLPPSDSHKKSKSNGSRRQEHGVHSVDRRHFASAFRSCGALLAKLMKHRFAWVFNTPVDVKALGLHDYYTIIRNPMDLGTVKSRLSKNWYKTPKEFAEDVRLTFSNAMTYNPKGQDVHYMAEQLLQIFEERWPSTEAEFAHLSYTSPPKKFLDLRTLERSDSTVHPMPMEPKPRPVNHVSHGGRTPALQKPKAKDLNKRNMTFEEKQKLSTNLSNLPGDKLANIVQIIKKRNASLIEDDEIEVDIDSVDIETLWELDRFVTNYKKSLSKHRRRAELAMLRRAQANSNMQGVVQERAPSYVVEVVRENVTVPDEQNVPVSVPVGGENNQNNGTKSSSSSSSSSDSGSSSSDSDSDSSSGSRPDSRRSPRP